MVYIDPENLGWLPYVKSWAQNIPQNVLLPEHMKFLMGLFTRYLPPIMKYVKKYGAVSIHQVHFY